MRDRLRNLWQILRSSLWILPALVTIVAVGLALGLLQLDAQVTVRGLPVWFFPGGAPGAREILATIASSVITVAGVAFSITIVALSLAASQYGSLLLATYLRDPVSQSSLGIFIGTFVYCLVVLGNISEAEGEPYVPAISVTFSLLLALASLMAFVAFINHLAQSMQSERLAARIGESLLESVGEMYPEELGSEPEHAPSAPTLPARFDAEAWEVRASSSGYLQAIEGDRLIALAKKYDVVVRLAVRPGDFVSVGTVVASALGGDGAKREMIEGEIKERLLIGRLRTPTQDPEYAVHQLAQTAVRALSPGINDPYTALTCIDWLEAALRLLTKRRLPSENRLDEQGDLRVVAPRPGFETMADAAFNKIRHAGREQASILLRLMKAVANLAPEARRSADCKTLLRHLEAVREDALASLWTEREKQEAEGLYQEIRRNAFGDMH